MSRSTKIAAVLAGLAVLGVGSWQVWRVRPTELRSVRLELPVPVVPVEPRESILAKYESGLRCTIYYSPRESGITKGGGFNMTLETRPGLNEHQYPADFLQAVQAEGYGRLQEPVEGKAYLRFWSKQWGFAEQPLDNRQRPLIPRQSCAVGRPFDLVRPEATIRIQCPRTPAHFNNLLWRVSDTGSGLKDRQLDLYWGEDDPLGPGNKLCRPKGLDCDLFNPTVLVVAQTK